MATRSPDLSPAELEALLERRRCLGQDHHDEVWEGVLHITPYASGEHSYIAHRIAVILDGPARAAGLWPTIEFNLGDSKDDYRVPDGGLHRAFPHGDWHHTAALVVEILSPGDETWEKLPFYAARHVDELLILDPQRRSVEWLGLQAGEYRPIDASGLIDLGREGLAQHIDWP